MLSNKRGELAATYIWTNSIWKINGSSSRVQENHRYLVEEYIPRFNKQTPKYVNMYPAGLGNTRILTNYAQKCPRKMLPKEQESYGTRVTD